MTSFNPEPEYDHAKGLSSAEFGMFCDDVSTCCEVRGQHKCQTLRPEGLRLWYGRGWRPQLVCVENLNTGEGDVERDGHENYDDADVMINGECSKVHPTSDE